MRISIEELKSLEELSKICASSEEAVFVTRGGYGDMVAMSQDLYMRIMNRHDNKTPENEPRGGTNDAADDALKELMDKLKLL